MKAVRFFLVAMLALVCLSSCSDNDYLEVIPADARMVASVDFKSMADKCDLEHNQAVMQLLTNFMSDNARSKKEREQVLDIIKNPNQSGIDFTAPMYIFITADRNFVGLTMRVANEGKIDDLIKMANLKVKEDDGLKCVSVKDEVQVAYDDDAFVMLCDMGLGLSSAKAKKRIVQLFDNDKHFSDTEAYDRLSSMEGDAKLWLNYGIVPTALLETQGIDVSEMMGGVQLKDVNLLGNLVFDKGCVRMAMEVYGSTKEAQKKLEANADYMQKINGTYLGLAHENCLLWGSVSVDGSKFLDMVKRVNGVKEALLMAEQEMDMDFSNMIRSVDGDVSFALNSDDMKDRNAPIYAAAKVNSDQYVKTLPQLFASAMDATTNMVPLSDNLYRLDEEQWRYDWDTWDEVREVHSTYVGVDGQHNFVWLQAKGTPAEMMSGNNAGLAKYKSDITSSYAYLYIDVHRMLTLTLTERERQQLPTEARKAMDLADVFIARMETKLKGESRLVVKDDSKNVLAVCMSLLNEFVEKNF